MLDAHLAVFLRGVTDFQQWHQEDNTLSQLLSLSEEGSVSSAGPPRSSAQPSAEAVNSAITIAESDHSPDEITLI